MRTRSQEFPSPYTGYNNYGKYYRTGYEFRSPQGDRKYYCDYSLSAANRTYCELNRCIDETHPGPPYTSGGPFNKWSYSDGGLTLRNEGTYYNREPYTYRNAYSGGFICSKKFSDQDMLGVDTVRNIGSDLDHDFCNFGDVDAYGASGWNRYKPAQPGADMAQFLAECKDIPRMLKKTSKFYSDVWKSDGRSPFGPKRASDEWLNTQFGWLPFINDLRKFYKTYKNLDGMIKQIRRDNGQWVKRGGYVSTTESRDVVTTNNTKTAHWPILTSYFYDPWSGPTGSHTVSILTTQKVWFKARFKYYIPNINSPIWEKRAIAALFGASISPALLYELTPWSWLIDWFSNVGDVISNVSNGLADNLVAKYAYIMGTTEKSLEVSSIHNLAYDTLNATWSYNIGRKTRSEANPFGFGLTDSDLSLRQWSILSALGIRRIT